MSKLCDLCKVSEAQLLCKTCEQRGLVKNKFCSNCFSIIHQYDDSHVKKYILKNQLPIHSEPKHHEPYNRHSFD